MNDPRFVAARDLTPDRRRGGELRVLLGPRTVGSTSGFLGMAVLRPGERINEHYHPYSEEFLYVARGEIIVDLDDLPVAVRRAEALFVPMNTRHRLRNVGRGPAEVVFHLSPLAPRPELGHVDTEGPAVLGPGPQTDGPQTNGPQTNGTDATRHGTGHGTNGSARSRSATPYGGQQ